MKTTNFTQQHFNAIADVIKTRLEAEDPKSDHAGGVRLISLDLAALFLRSNPQFNPSRFFVAAGMQHHA